jgi:hypothetical protein
MWMEKIPEKLHTHTHMIDSFLFQTFSFRLLLLCGSSMDAPICVPGFSIKMGAGKREMENLFGSKKC